MVDADPAQRIYPGERIVAAATAHWCALVVSVVVRGPRLIPNRRPMTDTAGTRAGSAMTSAPPAAARAPSESTPPTER